MLSGLGHFHSPVGDLHRRADVTGCEEDFIAAEKVMRFLVNQLLPRHVVGQVPRGGLGCSLAHFARADELAQLLNLRVVGIGSNWLDLIGYGSGWFFFAVLKANRLDFHLSDLFGGHIERPAYSAADAAADA